MATSMPYTASTATITVDAILGMGTVVHPGADGLVVYRASPNGAPYAKKPALAAKIEEEEEAAGRVKAGLKRCVIIVEHKMAEAARAERHWCLECGENTCGGSREGRGRGTSRWRRSQLALRESRGEGLMVVIIGVLMD
jgi:hypothetical protein